MKMLSRAALLLSAAALCAPAIAQTASPTITGLPTVAAPGGNDFVEIIGPNGRRVVPAAALGGSGGLSAGAITSLPGASGITGAEAVPCVQGVTLSQCSTGGQSAYTLAGAISSLTAATPLTGAEISNIVQGGAARQTTIAGMLAQVGVRQTASTVTASTLTIPNDPSLFYLMNSASAQAVMIPAGLTRWAVGNTLTLVQLGAGQVQLAAGSGVSIVKRSSTLNSVGQNSVISLVNIGPDTWLVAGGLS